MANGWHVQGRPTNAAKRPVAIRRTSAREPRATLRWCGSPPHSGHAQSHHPTPTRLLRRDRARALGQVALVGAQHDARARDRAAARRRRGRVEALCAGRRGRHDRARRTAGPAAPKAPQLALGVLEARAVGEVISADGERRAAADDANQRPQSRVTRAAHSVSQKSPKTTGARRAAERGGGAPRLSRSLLPPATGRDNVTNVSRATEKKSDAHDERRGDDRNELRRDHVADARVVHRRVACSHGARGCARTRGRSEPRRTTPRG